MKPPSLALAMLCPGGSFRPDFPAQHPNSLYNPFVKKTRQIKTNPLIIFICCLFFGCAGTGPLHAQDNAIYIGVWLYGRDGYYLWHVKGYDNFLKKFNELKGKMELVDLEVIY